MKKKLISSILTLSLLLGGGQVYAANVLNTNIFTLITNTIASIKDHYISTSNNDLDTINLNLKSEINNYVDSEIDKSFDDIETHKNNEINRANEELDQYLTTIKEEVNSSIDLQVKDVKNNITENVNIQINSVKEDMEYYLQEKLNDKLNKKLDEKKNK